MSGSEPPSLREWLEGLRAEYWTRLGAAETEAGGSASPYVVFTIASRRFAVDARLAKGVVRAPRVVRLPGVPPYILGLAGVRGEVISVTDPALLLGLPGERPPGGGYLLMLASEGVKAALWVDRICDVAQLPEDRLLPLEAPWPGAPPGVLAGQSADGASPPLLLVDGKRYLEVSAIGDPGLGE